MKTKANLRKIASRCRKRIAIHSRTACVPRFLPLLAPGSLPATVQTKNNTYTTIHGTITSTRLPWRGSAIKDPDCGGRLRAIVLWLAVLFAIFPRQHAAGEQLELIESLFLHSGKASLLSSPQGQLTGRSRLATLNPTALSRLETDPTQRLYRLEVFGREHLLRIVSHKSSGENLHSFVAAVEGDPDSQVLLVQKGAQLAGSAFFSDGSSLQINPRHDHRCELNEMQEFFPPLCGVGAGTESLTPPGLSKMQGLSAMASTPEPPEEPNESYGRDMEREIEVMMVYTPRAKAGAFGAELLELSLHAAIAEANLVFQNSGTGVQLRLVHLTEIDYVESGDMNLDLRRLQSQHDGHMDEVHGWRDAFQADLVCLVVDRPSWYQGMALFPAGPKGGFTVLDRPYLTGFGLFAHELGHNFGCDHDRESATGHGQFDYSFGHRLEADDQVYRTVMCYAPGWPIPFFSSPHLTYKDALTGVEAGESGQADNARTIRKMAAFIDSYRGLAAVMSRPTEGMVLTEGDPVALAVSVTSTEGAVQRVEFFANAPPLGELTDDSGSFSWTNPTPGKHVLWAQVTLTGGMTRKTDAITVGVRPHNDDFARRSQLAGTNLVATTVLFAAGAEPGEPAHFGTAPHSAWWTWTAPISGMVRVAASGMAWARPRAAVYRGEALQELDLVVKADSPVNDAFFFAAAGEQYQIVLDGEAAEVPVSLYLTVHQPPANDNFANAQTVGSSAIIQGTTLAATREPGEPQIGNARFGHSIWFCFTPSFSQRADLMIAAATDPLTDLAVFTGEDLPALTLFATSRQARQGFHVIAGVSYWIGVDGPYGDVTLNLRGTRPPANDDFARNTTLITGNGLLTVNNHAATREPNEPVHGGIPGGHSQWWSLRSSSSGVIRFTRTGILQYATPPLALAIYTGAALTNLVLQASHGFIGSFQSSGLLVVTGSGQIETHLDTGSVPQESFVFPVRGGTDYFIAVDGKPATVAAQTIRLEWMQRPANDHFQQRQVWPSMPASVGGTTFGATSEADEPPHGGRPAEHSVWWSWPVLTNGLVSAIVQSSGPKLPFLSVYHGDALNSLVCVADNGSGYRPGSTVVFPVEAGKPFHIAVDEESSSFNYSLWVEYVSRPFNDDFADRVRLYSPVQKFPKTTVAATSEPGEPEHARTASGRSVWFTWTARTPGPISILAAGLRRVMAGGPGSVSQAGLPSPLLAIYTGSSLAELEPVASGLGQANFQAERDVFYQIAVDGMDGQCGEFSLHIVPVPNNDSFLRAAPLQESPASIYLSPLELRAATAEADEPAHAGVASGHSLWWTWMPRQSGICVLGERTSAYGNPMRVVKAVYTGATLSDLTVVASNRWGNLPFTTTAGVRHYIAVDLEDASAPSVTSARDGQISITLSRPVTFVPPILRPDQTVDFVLAGTPGQTVLLQTSTDLIEWQPFKTVVLPSTSYRFSDPQLLFFPQKFYRAVPEPVHSE